MINHPTTALQTSPFSQEEKARLIAYKQALQAGFYSETPSEDEQPTYHFTMAELLRLSRYKAAVQAGFYHEGR
jgi:hypothetical protein